MGAEDIRKEVVEATKSEEALVVVTVYLNEPLSNLCIRRGHVDGDFDWG